MDEFAGLVIGLPVALFAAGAIGSAVFKVRYWRDWPDRWQSAHPAVSMFLAMDLFTRAPTRDRALPRSKRQAVLWEAPTFFIAGATLLLVVVLVVRGIIP